MKNKIYFIKEIFYSLQGEGAQVGRPAVFCRFSGCNLWSGREKDREKAHCRFCDTDFLGTDGVSGGKYDAKSLADKINSFWSSDYPENKYVVCTGGEPLLQLDESLIKELHLRDFEIAIETNGTIEVPEGIDWVCVSPKSGVEFSVKRGDEIKIVFPQEGVNPKDFEVCDFKHFFIQPLDNDNLQKNIKDAIDFCLRYPKWRLSMQTHKFLRIP